MFYDVLQPHVDKLVVCNPRKTALLKDGNKSDRIDARKLADRLLLDDLNPVYYGETGVRTLRRGSRFDLTAPHSFVQIGCAIKEFAADLASAKAERDAATAEPGKSLPETRTGKTRKQALAEEAERRELYGIPDLLPLEENKWAYRV